MMDKMTAEQKKVLDAEGKIVIKACPGSGKTYTVAHKLLSYINNWEELHSGVAVLSFTNVASDEISEKVKSIYSNEGKLRYPHFIGTVDSFINEFIVLRYGHLLTLGSIHPRILLEDCRKIKYKYWKKKCYPKCVNNTEPFYYGIDNKFYIGKKEIPCNRVENVKLPCEKYRNNLWKQGFIFQNETAVFAYKLLQKYPRVAEAITERFPVIIIDEAQDTSMSQMAIFELLSKAGLKSIFLVGDPDQSIYEWRNANPEYMISKLEDPDWKTIELTGNFRSSQNICNVTSFFSSSLCGKRSNNAVGKWAEEATKPVLLLTKEKEEQEIIDYFLDKCIDMEIDVSPKNVAVLTRGRIYSDTNISNLWKSEEIELFAKAAYEWKYNSRKKAYRMVSKASFSIIFNEDLDEYLMNQKIKEYADEDDWNEYLIDVIVAMPDIEIGIEEWVKRFSNNFLEICSKHNYRISSDKKFTDIFKIKQRDAQVPDFKKIPLRKYFEKKEEGKYTRSSIHGVKGESYDAVLLYVKSRRGNTITPTLLRTGDLNLELMHLVYVAMTRPKRLLMVAVPNDNKIQECERFPSDLWNVELLG